MKHFILIALAGGLLYNNFDANKCRKHDLFYKADLAAKSKKAIQIRTSYCKGGWKAG